MKFMQQQQQMKSNEITCFSICSALQLVTCVIKSLRKYLLNLVEISGSCVRPTCIELVTQLWRLLKEADVVAPLIELEEVLVTVPVPQLLLTSVTVDEVEENDAVVTEQSAIMKKKKKKQYLHVFWSLSIQT